MPLFPKLVGGLTVRERPSRYEGEPRYRRLDFVRPRSEEKSDSWPVIYSSEPMRAVQLYSGNPYHNNNYHQGNWHPGFHQAHARPGGPAMLPHLSQFPAGHPIHYVPAPALSDHPVPRQIEPRRPIRRFEAWDDDGDDDNDIIAILEGSDEEEDEDARVKVKKGKTKAKLWPSGHSIFDSSSEDEARDKRKKGKKKARGWGR